MNSKHLAIIVSAALLSSCTTLSTNAPDDWPALQWEEQSARLTIVGADENMNAPFDGHYLSIPGYIFVGGHISLHPGKKRISYGCPLPEGAVMITHYVPSVEFTFKKGRQYELRCAAGNPVITDVTAD